jgi:hypothetical protein
MVAPGVVVRRAMREARVPDSAWIDPEAQSAQCGSNRGRIRGCEYVHLRPSPTKGGDLSQFATHVDILRAMPLRSFQDAAGTRWEVWEAHATLEERRRDVDRRSEPRSVPDRRESAQPGFREQGEGWLVFRSEHARRRHIPIPPAWDKLRDAELEALMRNARPSGPRSRITE